MSTITQQTVVKLELEGAPVCLTYQLLCRPIGPDDAPEGPDTEYGVRILLEGLGDEPEVAVADGITCEEGKILWLIAALAAGRVTPVSLLDIVDDFLAQDE